METPVRRMTRSQTGSGSAVKPPARPASSSAKKGVPRRALSDLTNDSPISGLMPSSMAGNAGCVYESTPRSKLRPVASIRGEDVLRNQVTNLLKKVESAQVVKSSTILLPNLHNPEAFESPMRLAAPTPANTPATASWPSAQEVVTVSLPESRLCSSLKPVPPPLPIYSPVCHLDVCSPREECQSNAPITVPFRIKEIMRSEEVTDDAAIAQPTTRTLQFDSPEKIFEHPVSMEESITRTLLFESPQRATLPSVESSAASPSPSQADDEDDCGWSVIVNVNSPETKVDQDITQEDFEGIQFANSVLTDPDHGEQPSIWSRRSTPKKQIEEDDYEDCDEEYDYEDSEDDDEGEVVDGPAALDELCKGISHISMGDGELRGLPEFQGKHVRFNYNSDDEIEEEVVRQPDSPSKLKLKGCPTPRGKHLRFTDDQE